jgi:hypothetical protein
MYLHLRVFLMKLGGGYFRLVFLFLAFVFLSNIAAAGGLENAIKNSAKLVLCDIYNAFRAIVTGVAAVVFVLAGVKWTASENDPGARKAAKEAMIHAIVGMLIILVIKAVVDLVMGEANWLCT